MIFEIPALVSELVPGLFRESRVSIACVRTTQPKYLVFGADADRPACVVQFGPRDEMERTQRILSVLHAALPDMVAAPLACTAWRDDLYVQIQSGLPGMPWFRLGDRVRSARAWESLGQRAMAALRLFQDAVRGVPEWTGRLRPGAELRRQAAACAGHGLRLSTRAREGIDEAAEILDDLGERRHFWQHGDYCLNNLLISRSGLAIIDFDEFGGTLMPWHDEIGLSLSLNMLSPQGARPMAEALQSVPMPQHADWPRLSDPHVSRGFVLHHLLWRINQAAGRPTRARARASLVGALERFAAGRGALPPARVGC